MGGGGGGGNEDEEEIEFFMNNVSKEGHKKQWTRPEFSIRITSTNILTKHSASFIL